MARLASRCLKPSGRLISIVGNDTLGPFIIAVSEFLTYEDQAITLFQKPSRNLKRKSVDNFRSYLIFRKSKHAPDVNYSNLLPASSIEKKYDDYQQPLAPSLQLVSDFTSSGSLIVDTFLGTGTNALATSLAAEGRRFVGCDVRSRMIKVAKHRILNEGKVA